MRPIFPRAIVFKSLHQFLARVHDERPVASHGFTDRFAGYQQQANWRGPRVGDADGVPVVAENHETLLVLNPGFGSELRLAANHVSESIERLGDWLRETGARRQGQVQIKNWRPALDGSADSQRFPAITFTRTAPDALSACGIWADFNSW